MRAKHTLYLSFFLSVLLLTATQNVFGQAGNAQITANDPRHETLNQREVSVLFDQTILSATTAGWAVTVNAIPVTVNSVLVVGNRVNITFDATPAHAAQNFLIPGDVLRVSYDQATGNTLTATAGNPEVNSFGLSISKNRWIGNCTDLAFFQIGDYAAPDICSPVNNNFRQFQYFLSLRLRNSAVFNYASQMRYQINWGDASALQNVAPYLSDNAGTANAAFYTTVPGFPASVTTSRVTHAFPDNTNVCSFNVRIFPYIDGVLNCNIGSLLQTSTFISYDMDDQNTGILSLIPSVANSHRVCQGNNANMRFSDATTLNCVPDVPNIGAPNIQARWIRIVYGYQNAPGPGNIPNIVVNGPLTGGAQNITNGAGVISPAAGYFPTGAGGIGVPDFNGVIELNTPVNVSTATTFMQTITTSSAAGQLVGQRFYVRLEYWNTCNPYNPGDLSNRVATDNYIEIVAKPTNPVATNKEYCFTETFASGGTCGAPTGEFFELTAGSVAGSTEIKWYNTLADATADASAIASTYGTNCRFLRPENRTGGTGAMAAAGVYSVFARYRTGAAAPNNCLSDPIQVNITRRSALSAPGVISPLTSDVCDGSTNVPYSLASAAPVVAFGGATEYSWSFSGGSWCNS
jgi:hypothetical protein